jgi:sodium/potassium/calcium exchanger 6
MSIVWIYVVANELLAILKSLGDSWGINKAIIALTVLSWGNSIGDTVSDVVVARQGYPAMAVGACLGSPMLNLLIGLGISLTFAPEQLKHKCYVLAPEPAVSLAFLFLLISLLSTLIVIPVCKFRGFKLYGLYLILLYITYLSLAIPASINEKLGEIFMWKVGNGCKMH